MAQKQHIHLHVFLSFSSFPFYRCLNQVNFLISLNRGFRYTRSLWIYSLLSRLIYYIESIDWQNLSNMFKCSFILINLNTNFMYIQRWFQGDFGDFNGDFVRFRFVIVPALFFPSHQSRFKPNPFFRSIELLQK